MTTLQIDQGDDEVIHLTVKSPRAEDAPDSDAWREDDTSTWGPLDLAGAKLWFNVLTGVGTIVFAKNSDSGQGIEITDEAGGLADVTIAASETASLRDALLGKSLRVEVQVRSGAGKTTTLKRASLTIVKDRLTA